MAGRGAVTAGDTLVPFVPSVVEGWAESVTFAARPSTVLGTNGNGVARSRQSHLLSYTPGVCQRSSMLGQAPMLRHPRQRLNFLNIREVA